MAEPPSYMAQLGSRPGRDALDLYLAPTSANPPPVYCFQHTMKTGGTTLRSLIYRNLVGRMEFAVRLVPKKSRDFRQVYATLYADLGDDRDRLCWAISHSAAYLAPLLDRPVQPITIVREPVDRAISRHLATPTRRGSRPSSQRRTLD